MIMYILYSHRLNIAQCNVYSNHDDMVTLSLRRANVLLAKLLSLVTMLLTSGIIVTLIRLNNLLIGIVMGNLVYDEFFAALRRGFRR
jgi:hypothetical protein